MDFDDDLEDQYDYAVLEQINHLYDTVMEPFKRGESLVCNPDIFKDLTKDKFRQWIKK